MELSDAEVAHVARLARLALSPEERARMREQLGKVLGHMEDLKKLDTKDVPPTAQTLGKTAALRTDVAQVFPHIDDILKLSPQREENYFKVPKVIE